MAKKSVAERVKETIKPIVESLGYELVDVNFKQGKDGNNLIVYIDNDSPITLDDCTKVSHAIDEPLDILDPIEESYNLNVSSCGLDWAFRTDRDYQKNIGQIVEINLFAPINKQKLFVGKLESFDTDNVTILSNSNQIKLPRKAIAKICRQIEF